MCQLRHEILTPKVIANPTRCAVYRIISPPTYMGEGGFVFAKIVCRVVMELQRKRKVSAEMPENAPAVEQEDDVIGPMPACYGGEATKKRKGTCSVGKSGLLDDAHLFIMSSLAV